MRKFRATSIKTGDGSAEGVRAMATRATRIGRRNRTHITGSLDGETVNDGIVAFTALEDKGGSAKYIDDGRRHGAGIVRVFAGDRNRFALEVEASEISARRDDDGISMGVSGFDG